MCFLKQKWGWGKVGSESSRAQHGPPPPGGFPASASGPPAPLCGPHPPHMLGLCALHQGSIAEQRLNITLEQWPLGKKSINRGEDSSDLHPALFWGRARGIVPILWVRKLRPEREETSESITGRIRPLELPTTTTQGGGHSHSWAGGPRPPQLQTRGQWAPADLSGNSACRRTS